MERGGGVSIYVLELEQGKYYVGKTRNPLPQSRILDHFNFEGSAWTSLYPPIRVVDVQHGCSDFDEDKKTKEMMATHGITNVRGGTYCQVKLDFETQNLLRREIWGARDRCLRCGRNTHFVSGCYASTTIDGEPIDRNEEGDSEESESEGEDACYRCGRLGHWADECYARTDVSGRWL